MRLIDLDALWTSAPELSQDGWVLITGEELGLSSGVPQPFARSRWAPSLVDLVRFQLLRTQSRAVFERLEPELDDGESNNIAPLSFVGRDLGAQEAWLQDVLRDLRPDVRVRRAADLVRAGLINAIATNAYDDLFLRALEQGGVSFREVVSGASKANRGSAPCAVLVLRERSDRVFWDDPDRRERERAFVTGHLATLLTRAVGVVVIGCAAARTDLIEALDQCLSAPGTTQRLIWSASIDEIPPQWAKDSALGDRLLWVQEPRAGLFVDTWLERRGIQASAPDQATDAQVEAALAGGLRGGLQRLLSRSFDLRPVLLFVPGVAIFSGLVERLPRVSLRVFLSALSLVAVVMGVWNWIYYSETSDALARAEQALDAGRERLRQGDALGAWRALESTRAQVEQGGALVVPMLHAQMTARQGALEKARSRALSTQVLPALYRHQLEAWLRADSRWVALEGMSAVSWVEQPPPGAAALIKGRARHSYALPQDLEALEVLALGVAPSEARMLLGQQVLGDIAQGALPLLVPITQSAAGPDESVREPLTQVMASAGVEWAHLWFSPTGEPLFLSETEQKCVFYIWHLDAQTARSALPLLEGLRARWPRCGLRVAYDGDEAHAALAGLQGVVFLRAAPLSWSARRGILWDKTSGAFAQGVLRDPELRGWLMDPVRLALLIEHFAAQGAKTPNAAQLQEHLLIHALEPRRAGFGARWKAVVALAKEAAQQHGEVPRVRALDVVDHIAKSATEDTPDEASRILDLLVSQGVLRDVGGGAVAFREQRVFESALARALQETENKDLLAQQSQHFQAFYAGIDPQGARALVGGAVARYEEAARGLDPAWVNVWLPSLAQAVEVARTLREAGGGEVAALEAALWAAAAHPRAAASSLAVELLFRLSPTRLQLRLIQALAQGEAPFGAPELTHQGPESHDDKILRAMEKAPSLIYLSEIERWLARLGTAQDPLEEARLHKGEVTFTTRSALVSAAQVLIDMGSPEAIRVLKAWAVTEAFEGRPAALAKGMRAVAQQTLLIVGLGDALVGHLAGVSLEDWISEPLLFDLHHLHHPEARDVLLKVLSAPSAPERVRLDAAAALSRQPAALTDGALMSLSADREVRSYVALVLGYRGGAQDFAQLKALIARLPPAEPLAAAEVERYGIALAYSQHPEAFALWLGLRARAVDPPDGEKATTLEDLNIFLRNHIRLFQGLDADLYGAKALLCEPLDFSDEHAQTLAINHHLQILGQRRTARAHQALRSLWQLGHGVGESQALDALCGPVGSAGDAQSRRAHALQVAALVQGRHLSSFMDALASHQDPTDVPDWARWAQDPSLPAEARQAATEALMHLHDDAATAAFASLIKLSERPPGDPFLQKVLLKLSQIKPPREALESPLLSLLSDPSRDPYERRKVVQALGAHGGAASLQAIYRLQADPELASAAAYAALEISTRLLRDLPTQAAEDALRVAP